MLVIKYILAFGVFATLEHFNFRGLIGPASLMEVGEKTNKLPFLHAIILASFVSLLIADLILYKSSGNATKDENKN